MAKACTISCAHCAASKRKDRQRTPGQRNENWKHIQQHVQQSNHGVTARMSFMDVDQIDFSPPPSAPRGPSAGGSYGRGPRRASHGRGRGRGGQPLPRATPNLTYRNPQIQIQTQQGQALHIRARGQGRGRVGRTQFLRQDFDGLPDAEPKYPLHPPISLGAKQYNPQEDLENLPDAGTDARPLRNLPSDRLRRQQQQRWPPLGEHPSLYADPNNYPPFPPLIVSDIESESGGDDYQDRFVPQIPQPHSQAYQSQGQTAPNFFLPTQLRSIRQRSQPQQREPHYHQQFPTDVNPGFSQDYVNRRTPPQPRLRERPEQTLDPNTPEPKGQENLEKVFFSAIGSGIGVLKKSRGKVDHQVCHNLVERALQRVEQEAGRSASDFLSPSHKDAFIKILVTEILRPRAHVSVESSLSLVGTWYENARKPANLFQAQSFSTPEPTVTPRTAFITPPMDNSALLQFLSIIDGLIAGRNGDQLSQFIVIEPDPQGNFPQDYASLIQSIRSGFPPNSDDALEKLCSIHLPTARKGADEIPWNEFVRFIVGYLRYLTLADVQNLLQTFNLVSDLVQ